MICDDPYTYHVAYTPNTVAGEFLKSPDFGQRTKSFHNLVTCDFPTPEKKSAFVASEKTIELRYDMPMTAPDVSNGLTQWSIAGQGNPTAVAINGSIVVLTISSLLTCGPSYSINYYPNGNANQRLSSATSGKRAHSFSTNVDCPPAPDPLRAMITSAHTVDLPFNFEIAASDVSKLHEAIYYESTLYQSKRVYARKASISGAVLTLTFGVLPKTACYNSGISQIQFNSNSNPLVLVGAGTFAQKRTSFQVHDIKCAKRCDGSAAPLYGSVGDCDSVVSGMTCQPTCASGFTVSGTSSCSFVGEFTSATCSPQGCDVPSTINEAGIFSWNNALCTPSATVPNGTTCTINENEGYICSSPGLCVRGSFSSVAAQPCSLRIPEVQSRKIISATSVEIVFDLALSGTIDPAQFTLTPNGATPTAAILNGKVLMLTVDTMTTADCGNRQITYTKASADLFDRRLKTPQGGEVAGFNNKPLSCDTCDGSTIPVHGAIGSCSSAVTAGASCQPTCNTGYTVSGPAFCDLGTQFVPAVCNPNDCAMPVITEGVFKWSDPKCGSGSLNVPSGTTCLITADTDYTCISPGKCTAEVFERNGTCFRTCPAGSYFAGSGAKPTDKNFYKDSVCTACPSGKFSKLANANACEDHTMNCYLNLFSRTENACFKCPAGKYRFSKNETTCHWVLDPACVPGQHRVPNKAACVDCPVGKFSLGGVGRCRHHLLECPAGKFRAHAGSMVDDALCLDCGSGQYRTRNMFPDNTCAPHSVCLNETSVFGNATHDAVCGHCIRPGFVYFDGKCFRAPFCSPGTRLGRDRRCHPCRDGYFQNAVSNTVMDRCPYEWIDCHKQDKEVASFGTYTTPGSCRTCAAGTFYNSSARSCFPWTDCFALYEYVVRPGSDTSDRLCGTCQPFAFSEKTNDDKCNETNHTICMKMQGKNCTETIDFELDQAVLLKSLLDLDILHSTMIGFYGTGALSVVLTVLAICLNCLCGVKKREDIEAEKEKASATADVHDLATRFYDTLLLCSPGNHGILAARSAHAQHVQKKRTAIADEQKLKLRLERRNRQREQKVRKHKK